MCYNKKELTRWYYLHSFGNALVCYYTFNPMIQLLLDPIYYIQNPIWMEESTILIAILHLYHLLFFKCTFEDWVHHLLFVLLGTITHYLVNWGHIIVLYHFFICGLPGGIDYLALALVKDKIITKNTRLKLAVELNTWIRAPGIIVSWTFGYIWYIYRYNSLINTICFIIMTIASVINAQYYSRLVTLTAGKKLYKYQ